MCTHVYYEQNNNVVVLNKKTLYNFTRMSTPAGNSNPINASIVCAVGSYTSITLLCVLVSKCSRESLFTCGERKTQKMRLFVGNGIGPLIRASVAVAASMILSHAACMCVVSKDFKRILIFDAATGAAAVNRC